MATHGNADCGDFYCLLVQTMDKFSPKIKSLIQGRRVQRLFVLIPASVSLLYFPAFYFNDEKARALGVGNDKIPFTEFFDLPIPYPQRVPCIPSFWEGSLECVINPSLCLRLRYEKRCSVF